MAIITVKDLIFEYPENRVLNQLNFEIEANSVVALVGPNGVGKTTLLRLLAALEDPYSGEIIIDGISTIENPRLCHQKIGYLSDHFGLYDELTAYQSLLSIASLRKIDRSEAQKRIAELDQILSFSDFYHLECGNLSRGQRQKIGIAQSCLHRPKILLLDEPASGLDPEARFELSVYFRKLKEQGVTIIVSSHILSELEDYSDRMLPLNKGKINEQQSILAVKVAGILKVKMIEITAAEEKKISEILKDHSYQIIETAITIEVAEDSPRLRQQILKDFVESGLSVIDFSYAQESFQDVYLKSLKK